MGEILTTGMTKNCPKKPIAGPMGLFKMDFSSPQSMAQPKLMYKILTNVATEAVNMMSMKRFFLMTTTSKLSLHFSFVTLCLQRIEVLPKKELNMNLLDFVVAFL